MPTFWILLVDNDGAYRSISLTVPGLNLEINMELSYIFAVVSKVGLSNPKHTLYIFLAPKTIYLKVI